MSLDVTIPEPPDLSNRGRPQDFEWEEETLGSEDFRREDLEDLLQEGAWTEGFDEWTEYTDLDAEQVGVVDELGLFRAFDFYWDPTEDRLRYFAPTLPEDWRDHDATASLDSSTESMVNNALDDLGRSVQDVLEDYLESDEETTSFSSIEQAYGDREE